MKKMKIKTQSSILITCVSCIVLLLVICFFTVSNTKDTYSVKTFNYCPSGYKQCSSSYDCECYKAVAASKVYYCPASSGWYACQEGYSCYGKCYKIYSSYTSQSSCTSAGGTWWNNACYFYKSKSYYYSCSSTGGKNGNDGYCYFYADYAGTYKQYTLTFKNGTTTLASKTCNDINGGCRNIEYTPATKKEGYTFNGWGLTSSCTSGSTSLNPTMDTTYYACWKKNTSCSLDANTISGGYAVSTVTGGESCCANWEYNSSKKQCRTSLLVGNIGSYGLRGYYLKLSGINCASGYFSHYNSSDGKYYCVESQSNDSSSCTYKKNTVTGNTVSVAVNNSSCCKTWNFDEDEGTCTKALTNANGYSYYFPLGGEMPTGFTKTTINNATAYMKCSSGYELKNGACVATTNKIYATFYDGSSAKSFPSCTLTNGNTRCQITTPPALTRSGNTFAGWSKDDCKTKSAGNVDIYISGGEKYYACWESYCYRCFENANDQSNTTPDAWKWTTSADEACKSVFGAACTSESNCYKDPSITYSSSCKASSSGGTNPNPDPTPSDPEPTPSNPNPTPDEPDDSEDPIVPDDTPTEPDSDIPSVDDNVTENPITGSIAIFIVWVITLVVIIYGCWYIKRLRTSE